MVRLGITRYGQLQRVWTWGSAATRDLQLPRIQHGQRKLRFLWRHSSITCKTNLRSSKGKVTCRKKWHGAASFLLLPAKPHLTFRANIRHPGEGQKWRSQHLMFPLLYSFPLQNQPFFFPNSSYKYKNTHTHTHSFLLLQYTSNKSTDHHTSCLPIPSKSRTSVLRPVRRRSETSSLSGKPQSICQFRDIR